MLRAHHCVRCGDPMPLGRRVDRKFCRASCRTSAYRERRRGTPPRRAGRGRRQEPGQPLPLELLQALRQVPPAVLTALAGWFGEHASNEQLTAARQRITELEQQVQRIRAELTAQQEAHHREQQRQREEESAQRARDHKAREAEGCQRLEAATKQIVELKDALWRLQAQSAEQAAALNQERDEHAFTRQSAIQQVAEYARQLRQALSEKESAESEAQRLCKQLHAAQARCDELQSKVAAAKQEAREQKREHRQSLSELRQKVNASRHGAKPKRLPRTTARRTSTPAPDYQAPPSAGYYDDDELTKLMIDYVVLRDDLARYARLRGVDPNWTPLPDRSREAIIARAMALAILFRRKFYDRSGRPYDLQPTWIVFGQRMDDVSEALMQAELRLEIEKLRKKRKKAW